MDCRTPTSVACRSYCSVTLLGCPSPFHLMQHQHVLPSVLLAHAYSSDVVVVSYSCELGYSLSLTMCPWQTGAAKRKFQCHILSIHPDCVHPISWTSLQRTTWQLYHPCVLPAFKADTIVTNFFLKVHVGFVLQQAKSRCSPVQVNFASGWFPKHACIFCSGHNLVITPVQTITACTTMSCLDDWLSGSDNENRRSTAHM